MAAEEGLFEKFKQCEFCGRALSPHYEANLCPRCMDNQLFRDVKEFIRANTVNEYEVADHFNIPLRQVKEWIREGRIEYRTEDANVQISSMHCQRCGAPVTFGLLCAKCLKLINGNKGFSSGNPNAEENRMRFLDSDRDS